MKLVLAATAAEAVRFIHDHVTHMGSLRQVRVLSHRYQLRGLRRSELIVLESARTRDDFREIMDEAQMYECRIRYVDDAPRRPPRRAWEEERSTWQIRSPGGFFELYTTEPMTEIPLRTAVTGTSTTVTAASMQAITVAQRQVYETLARMRTVPFPETPPLQMRIDEVMQSLGLEPRKPSITGLLGEPVESLPQI